MFRGSMVLGLIVCALLLRSESISQETNLLMHGTVTWKDGSPAASVKLVLLQGDEEAATVYTNQEGRYGFFDSPGKPSDYALAVYFRNQLILELVGKNMEKVPRGGRHDIALGR